MNQLDAIHYLYWKFHLMEKNVWLGNCLSYYLVTPFRFLSYMQIFQEVYIVCFHRTPQNGSVLVVFPHISPWPLSSTPTSFNTPAPVSCCFFLSWNIPPSIPVPYSKPNLCCYVARLKMNVTIFCFCIYVASQYLQPGKFKSWEVTSDWILGWILWALKAHLALIIRCLQRYVLLNWNTTFLFTHPLDCATEQLCLIQSLDHLNFEWNSISISSFPNNCKEDWHLQTLTAVWNSQRCVQHW